MTDAREFARIDPAPDALFYRQPRFNRSGDRGDPLYAVVARAAGANRMA